MDERIEQFERLWMNRARLPRLTTFDPETLPPDLRAWFYEERAQATLARVPLTPLAPLILPETLLVPAPLGLGSPPPRPNFPLLRSTNDPEPELGPLPSPKPLERQTNRHHLLSPNRLREWWEGDSLVKALLMRELA